MNHKPLINSAALVLYKNFISNQMKYSELLLTDKIMQKAQRKGVLGAVIRRAIEIAKEQSSRLINYITGVSEQPAHIVSEVLNTQTQEPLSLNYSRVWTTAQAQELCSCSTIHVFASVKHMAFFITNNSDPVHVKIPRHYVHSELRVKSEDVKSTLEFYYPGFTQIDNISNLYRRFDIITSML